MQAFSRVWDVFKQTVFHKDWDKIVDFFLLTNYWTFCIFYSSVFTSFFRFHVCLSMSCSNFCRHLLTGLLFKNWNPYYFYSWKFNDLKNISLDLLALINWVFININKDVSYLISKSWYRSNWFLLSKERNSTYKVFYFRSNLPYQYT